MPLATLSLPRISPDTCPALFSLPCPRPTNGNVIRSSEPPPLPEVMTVETVVWESPVQSVSKWRWQRAAEEGAGFASLASQVFVHSFLCDLCSIGIGKDHTEQELYFLPVLPGQRVRVKDSTRRYSQLTTLYCCGGCARRHHLSESQLAVPASTWAQTAVLSPASLRPLRVAFERVVLCCLLISWGIPIPLVFSHKPGQAGPATTQAQAQPVQPEKSSTRVQQAPLKQMTGPLSTLLSSYHAPVLRTRPLQQKLAQ